MCAFSTTVQRVFRCSAAYRSRTVQQNADILGDLVHLDKSPKGLGPETALDVVMHAVWGMLYADDACIVSRSPQGIAKIMSVFVEVFDACGLTVSEKKTEVMTMPAPRASVEIMRIEAEG